MKKLSPGIYDDEYGGLHLDLPELLAAAGCPDTPENQQTMIAAVAALCPPGTPITAVNVRRSYTCSPGAWSSPGEAPP